MITYKNKAQPLDIIVVYNPKSWLHHLIHRVTGYKAGHVAIYMGDGMITEAGSGGVIRRTWKNYKSGSRVYLARVLSLTESQELKIREYCFESERRPYAFGQLIMILIKNLFRVRHVPDVSRQAVICSEFIALVFKSAGVVLCPKVHTWETTPGDILKSEVVFLVKGWE
ncbi:MAG: hypothetical protein EHM45_05280 [Desulfobacteraceae bacterium]|nr:MAG: hypothetical protein EHM45_05280 [Desulfobacteraceae bacterium]